MLWLRILLIAGVLGGVGGLLGKASACPGCKESLPNQATDGAEPTANVAKGYAWSIVVMMSAPFVLAGGMGGMLYLNMRKSRLVPLPGAEDSPGGDRSTNSSSS